MSDNKKKNNLDFFSMGTNGKGILILHGFTGNAAQLELMCKYYQGLGYAIARPTLPRHSGRINDILKFDPVKAYNKAGAWLNQLSSQVDEVFIIGFSFGGNLAVDLSLKKNEKVKAIIAIEMPVLLRFKLLFMSYVVRPLLVIFGIEIIKKHRYYYRGRYEDDESDHMSFIPLRAIGEVVRYIRKKTKASIALVNKPFMLIHSEKSDLLSNRNAKFIYNTVPHSDKELYIVPIDNHNLNLLDDAGKILMVEKMSNFISQHSDKK